MRVIGPLAAGLGVLAVVALLRRRYLRWGATNEEVAMTLPGDDLVGHADLVATRAITISAAASDIWPWPTSNADGLSCCGAGSRWAPCRRSRSRSSWEWSRRAGSPLVRW